MSGADNWYIIRTAGRAEFSVHDAIHACGYVVYTPCEIKVQSKNQWEVKKSEARSAIPHPLIRSYVFSRVPIHHPVLALLRDRKRVYGVLGSNGEPYVLKQEAVDTMRKKYANEYDPLRHSSSSKAGGPEAFMRTGFEFGVGDMVQFEKGFHASVPLKVLSFEDADTTARVLLKGFAKETIQTIPISELILHETKIYTDEKSP